MYKKSGGSGKRPQIFIHGDASKTTWPGETIFDGDDGHFVFDASPRIKIWWVGEAAPDFYTW